MPMFYKPKIKPWTEEKVLVQEKLECAKETASITIPYGLQLQESLWNSDSLRLAIRMCLGSSVETFVSHHGVGKNNHINVWTLAKDNKTGEMEENLSSLTTPLRFERLLFINKRWSFVGFCNDLTLSVLTTKFAVVSSTFTGRTVLCMLYNENADELVTGIAGAIMTWTFPIKQTDPLVPGRIYNCSFTPDDWVHSLKFDSISRQIIAVSNVRIAIIAEKDYHVRTCFDKKSDFPFTTCVFYHPASYFITGDKNGTIRAWSTSLDSYPLVTQFLGHCDAITSLLIHDRQPLLVSSSLDKTVRIWNFDTFTQTYRLQTGEDIVDMSLISSDQLFYYSRHNLKVWNLNQFHSLFTMLSSRIKRCFRVTSPGYPARIVVEAVDGGIRLISPVHGYELTTMLPITTLNTTEIVGFAHDRRKEKLYVLLSSREVLVFESDNNPCCAHQLWRAECPDEGVCSIALLNSEFALTEEDLDLECGLLFAGHYNGQISLLDGFGVSMKEVQAHQGQVIFLGSSHGLSTSRDTIGSRDHLLSCGTDYVIRVWQVRHVNQRAIDIVSKSRIKLLQLPRELEMTGNTLCMAMEDHKVVMCRTDLDCGSAYGKKKNFEFMMHSKDEGHTAAINGISSCPLLGLFATSSEDMSVRIWDMDNHLIRELNFDDTLCGVCFLNPRGDLLVGFQSHISLVTLTDYLPAPYLLKDEPIEKHVQFDDHIQYWYDSHRVPTVPMNLDKRRPMLSPDIPLVPWEEESDSDEEKENALVKPEDDGLNWLRRASQRMSMMSQGGTSMLSRISIMQNAADMLDDRCTSVGGRASSLFDSALGTESQRSVSVRSHHAVDHLTNHRELQKSREEEKAACRPPLYWPCAPDCFIPNSVVRKLVKVRKPPEYLIPKIIRPVKEKKKKRKNREDDPFEAIDVRDESALRWKKRTIPQKRDKRVPPKISIDETGEKPTNKAFTKPVYSSKFAELRARRRTNATGQAIFEEMSDKEEEEEEQEPKLGYGERDLNFHSTPEGPETETEPEGTPEPKQLQPRPVKLRRPRPVEGSEVLKSIVVKDWYPRTMEGVLKAEDVLNDISGVMIRCSSDVFTDLCNDIVRVNNELGLPRVQRSLIYDLLIKNTLNESAAIRRQAVRTLARLYVTSKDAALSMIRRLIDASPEVVDETKEALRTLFGVNDMEGLSNLLMSLGVVSMYLPSRDNVILTELAERLGRAKQHGMDYSGDIDWESMDTSPVMAKPARTKRTRRLPAVARRRSFPDRRPPFLLDRASPSDYGAFRDELKQSRLGCKLLQQLGPISSKISSEFGKSPGSTPDDMGDSLRVKGKKLGSLDFPQDSGFARDLSPPDTPKEPASPVALPPLVGRRASRLQSMLVVSGVGRANEHKPPSYDVTPVLSSASIVSTTTAPQESSRVEKKEPERRKFSEISQSFSFEDVIDALDQDGDSHLGRAFVMAMLNLKRTDSFAKIGGKEGGGPLKEIFNLENFLKIFALIPSLLNKGATVQEAFDKVIHRRVDEISSDKPLMVKGVFPLAIKDIITLLPSNDEKTAIIKEKIEGSLQEMEGCGIGVRADQGFEEKFIDVDKMLEIFALFESLDDQKKIFKKVVAKLMGSVNRMDRLRHLRRTGKKEKSKMGMSLSSPGRLQKLSESSNVVYPGMKDDDEYEEREDRFVLLSTPVRKNLVPGICGERLVHSLNIRHPRPYPSREIESATSEQIIGTLPHRLSFHTGSRDWGQTSYGIMDVTWTTRGPRYAIDAPGVQSSISYMSAGHVTDHQPPITTCHDICFNEYARKTGKTGNIAPIFRERLKSITEVLPVGTWQNFGDATGSPSTPAALYSNPTSLLTGRDQWYVRDACVSPSENISTNYGSPKLPRIVETRQRGDVTPSPLELSRGISRERLLTKLDRMQLPRVCNAREEK
ncbi:uncharacterized protein LOC5510818 isoform X2 [Nematostella vectensis]|uniref:uncharacterized protein LOC5510818 isoform X2 n=1 Tax=Nematostella vectensis TaxID=45351 RepID=UPI00207742B2|nr:uncharacterized protein LOC5510818 isoform X2 [Nematostella vectensis]